MSRHRYSPQVRKLADALAELERAVEKIEAQFPHTTDAEFQAAKRRRMIKRGRKRR